MAVIEESQGGDETSDSAQLRYRLHQQSVLADFGIAALRAREIDDMLHRAVALCAEGMRTPFAKFLEKCPDDDRLLIRNGIGWREGIVGEIEIAADTASPAGFAYKTGEAVISNHLENEERFRTPTFMAEHGIRRAINVLVEAAGEKYGVLEVDSPDEGEFEPADLSFMSGFANLIGVAIERQQAEARLTAAIEHQELLTREASHRVKNSLALVLATISMQIRGERDTNVLDALRDVQGRIMTVARSHDLLWRGDTIGTVKIDELLCRLASELGDQSPVHKVRCDVTPIELNADIAMPLGLLLSELVTNSIKHAYGSEGGAIDVSFKAGNDGEDMVLTVSDSGRGLPPGFAYESAETQTLGARMIASLSRQLHGRIEIGERGGGTSVRMTMPPKSGGA